MYTPINPSFIILKWGLRGSTLYRHVFVMKPIKNKYKLSQNSWSMLMCKLIFGYNSVEHFMEGEHIGPVHDFS